MPPSNEPLLEALAEADAGVAPSPFGELTVEISGAPVSVQSKKVVRDAYIAQIKAELSKFQFVLTGQIFLDVIWHVPAKSRYETDAKADIDNCLKPIIDAFTGPDGIMIDDCQLKGLYISWIDSTSSNERLQFDFKFDSDQFCDRDGLAFLRLDKRLCCPVSTKWPMAFRSVWVKAVRAGEHCKAVLEKADTSYLAILAMTGGGQPFHITRIGGFTILSPEDFVAGNTIEA